jgi:hypothetical protein
MKERTMGYDKRRVYDVEVEIAPEPVHPLDEMVTAVKRLMESDRAYTAALWYAYGRLYYETSPLPTPGDEVPEADVPSEEDAAMGFAVQFQRMMSDFHDGTRRDVVRMVDAWDHYERSAGGTIEAIGE